MDTDTVIIILIYALIIAFVFYKSWKDRKKAKAGQAVFLDSLQDKMAVISNALAEINVNGKWDVTKEKDEATMTFQYQGGYFSIEISKRGNTARIVYPFFYGKSIVDILSLRTFINKINQSCGLAEVVYSCDTKRQRPTSTSSSDWQSPRLSTAMCSCSTSTTSSAAATWS